MSIWIVEEYDKTDDGDFYLVQYFICANEVIARKIMLQLIEDSNEDIEYDGVSNKIGNNWVSFIIRETNVIE